MSDRSASLGFAAARLTITGLGLVTTLGLVRILDVSSFGAFAAGIGVYAFVASVGVLGVDQLYLSADLDTRSFVALSLSTAPVLLVLVVGAAAVWPGLEGEARWVCVLLGAAGAAEAARGGWLLVPQRHGRFMLRARREVLLRVLVTAGTLAGASWGGSATSAAAGALVAALLTTVAVLASSAAWRARPSGPSALTGAWRRSWGFALSSMLFTAATASGPALLATFSTEVEAGRFRVAFLFFTAAMVVAVAINNEVVRPRLYTAAPTDRARIVREFVVLDAALGLVCGAGLLVVGRLLVQPVAGAGYETVPDLVVPLALAVPLAFLNSLVGNVLLAGGRLRVVLVVQVVGALTSVVVGVPLVARDGASGASALVLVVEVVTLGAYAGVLLCRRLGTRRAQSKEVSGCEPS